VLNLSFLEAVNGTSKSVNINVNGRCGTCQGSGSADGSKPVVCSTCRGTGQQQMQNGFMVVVVPCTKCKGQGTTIKNPCNTCSGSGTTKQRKSVDVQIPPGVETGLNMRLSGEGDAGLRGGAPGNLFINIQVSPDPFFEREGADIHVTIPIQLSQAVLGGSVSVPTVRGEVEMKIPAGTQPTDKLVIRGRGVQRLNGGTTGNQYVHFKIEIPKHLTTKQEQLMKEFATEEAAAGHGTGKTTSFLSETIDRIKRAMKS
jgi:molecular chaperone DnaJ